MNWTQRNQTRVYIHVLELARDLIHICHPLVGTGNRLYDFVAHRTKRRTVRARHVFEFLAIIRAIFVLEKPLR